MVFTDSQKGTQATKEKVAHDNSVDMKYSSLVQNSRTEQRPVESVGIIVFIFTTAEKKLHRLTRFWCFWLILVFRFEYK
jgi:hypothetical protein